MDSYFLLKVGCVFFRFFVCFYFTDKIIGHSFIHFLSRKKKTAFSCIHSIFLKKCTKKILSREIKIYDSFVGHFLKFFHVWIFVSTGGYRYFLNIFTYGFRFSRVQNDEFSSRRCPHNRFYFVYGCGGEVHRKWNGTPPFRGLCLFFGHIYLSTQCIPFFFWSLCLGFAKFFSKIGNLSVFCYTTRMVVAELPKHHHY